MKLNFIGGGQLGRSIARLLFDHTDCQIQGVLNQSLTSALEAIAFIGQGEAFESINALPKADIICIATGDEQIQAMCDQMHFEPGQIVLHFSGALPSSILQTAKDQGALIASTHPIKSFADPALAIKTFAGTPVSLEGDDAAIATIKPLFEAIGADVSLIEPEHKMRYHAACVMATNYLVTLNHISRQAFESAGMEYTAAAHTTHKIMQDTLNNIGEIVDCQKALTGPLKRGEVDIIEQHHQALEGAGLKMIYQALEAETEKLITA